MKLQEWIAVSPQRAKSVTLQGQSVRIFIAGLTMSVVRDLYHLDDHIISSSLSGPSLVLVPTNGVEICPHGDSCGIHYPAPCGPGFCRNKGDRFSKAQIEYMRGKTFTL